MAPDEALVTLRQRLHAEAEVAGQEQTTAATVAGYLDEWGIPVIAKDVGGHGILAKRGDGPRRILIRTELDALPLNEKTGATYQGTAAHHACGHDGHMAMVLAALRNGLAPANATLFVLFQPAEETGHGMQACLGHPAFPDELDAVLAFHNLPGVPLGHIHVRPGLAAVASTGVTYSLHGETSHAAEPEHGRNPIPAMGRVVNQVLESTKEGDEHAVASIVEIRGGAPRFGTSAGDCSLSATLRAGTDEALERMIASITQAAELEARTGKFTLERTFVEPFPATHNDAAIVAALQDAMGARGIPNEVCTPFPWSEDFGHATKRWPGALIGIGSGVDQPPLHSPNYDFPDELTSIGADIWTVFVEALA